MLKRLKLSAFFLPLVTLYWLLFFQRSSVFAANPGEVVINELMWMGTAASSSDEWIELYNNTDRDIDLTNWLLKSEDGTPQIVLVGTIPAKGYYLLERTDENTIKDIEANKIYSGALSDSGENLVLYDSYSVVVDSVSCSGGWFAGAKNPYYSMERINPQEKGWLKANWSNNNGVIIIGQDVNGNALFATPKAQNSIFYSGSIGDESGHGNPLDEHKICITEVSFSSSIDWVELYNYGEAAVDIANFMLTDLDGTDSRLAAGQVTLAPGKYAVVWWDENGVDETDSAGDLNGNGVADLYVVDTSLSATDDQIALMSAVSGGNYIDLLCWSNQNGEFSPGEFNDVEVLRVNNQWQTAADTTTESDCVPSQNIDAHTSLGRISPQAADTNAKNDWYAFAKQTPGQDNADIIPPQSVSDLAAITGEHEGEIILTWTSSGDDGVTGRANKYELMYSTFPDMKESIIFLQNWAPQESGNKESQTLSELAPNTSYYFTLTVIDEEGNASPPAVIAAAISQHDLTPPEVEISFAPEPPFVSGRIKIFLKITDGSALMEEPFFSCQIDTEPAVAVALTKQNVLWEGELELLPSMSEREIIFRYSVQDEFGNAAQDLLIYSCLKVEMQAADGQDDFTCYPNPFSPAKGEKISFTHPGTDDCTLEIFSLDGSLIFSQTSSSSLSWDGKNYDGGTVASGVYCYRLYSSTWQKKGKIALFK